jgi:hypothetical protein
MRAYLRSIAIALVTTVTGLAACGGSPSGPSRNGVGVGGTWTGTWQFVTAGATVGDAVSVTLTESGATATGTWSAASGASGELAFTTGQNPTGTATLMQTTLTGQVCSTMTGITGGTVSATRIELTLADPTAAALCQWATGQRFALGR